MMACILVSDLVNQPREWFKVCPWPLDLGDEAIATQTAVSNRSTLRARAAAATVHVAMMVASIIRCDRWCHRCHGQLVRAGITRTTTCVRASVVLSANMAAAGHVAPRTTGYQEDIELASRMARCIVAYDDKTDERKLAWQA